MKPKALNAVADQLASVLLYDAENALPLIAAAGGIPAGIAFSGDAVTIFRTVESLRRDGVPLTTLAIREGCGLDARRVDALADAAPLVYTVKELVCQLREHAASEQGVTVLRDEGRDVRDKLASLKELLEPLAGGAGDAVRTVDAASLLATEPPPHDVVMGDVCDTGAVVEIIGPSKVRKSFFAMQFSISMAAGSPFVGLSIPTPRRVMLANLELTSADLHRRLHRMARAARITADRLGDRLAVLNLRGVDGNAVSKIEAAAVAHRSEVLVVDPVYGLMDGDENSAEGWRPILARFNAWAERFGAVVYVHHDRKGDVASNATRDRGAGHSITGRNAYARMTLSPLEADPVNGVAVAFMLRGYAPLEDRAISFVDGAFEASDLPATAETSRARSARSAVKKLSGYEDSAIALLRTKGPCSPTTFKQGLREELGLSKGDADTITAALCDAGKAARWASKGFPPERFIGVADGLPKSYREDRREDQ